MVSFGTNFSSNNVENLPVSGVPFIAGLWSDITLDNEKSAIAITETNPPSTAIKRCIDEFLQEGFGESVADFDPTHFFMVTWKNATHNSLSQVQKTV